MKLLADDLFVLGGFPPYAVNSYLMGDVLVDSGTRFHRRSLLGQLRGRAVAAHALTHAHPDHQGSSHALCEALRLPLWCGEADADAAEDPRIMRERMVNHPIPRFVGPFFGGPGHPVARRLREGDIVGGFRVIDTPGHSAGHISFFRESDRVLVLGDVLANMHLILGTTSLREPPNFFSADPAKNRDAARKAAALNPALVCFGHGPPLRDAEKFARFVERLARS
jgi:glyoxylase-like metal-dependent hydrolase (beta-lactamase superfamily II)